MRALTAHVRVRLLYSQWTSWIEKYESQQPPRTLELARERFVALLQRQGVDLSRVALIPSSRTLGALQDHGPFFLRDDTGALALADFGFLHFDPETEAIDRNPGLTRAEIGAEHLRVHGARKVIWLEQGPLEEQLGRLENGRWGIGTGGHIDEFARFTDARTVLLAQVPESGDDLDPVLAETRARMEANFAILRDATDQDSQPFRILRVPTAELMTVRLDFDQLSALERSCFEGATPGEPVEFYLPGSYLNLVIANGVVITSRYWREGLPESIRRRDELARQALDLAFPDRTVVQRDATPLL